MGDVGALAAVVVGSLKEQAVVVRPVPTQAEGEMEVGESPVDRAEDVHSTLILKEEDDCRRGS